MSLSSYCGEVQTRSSLGLAVPHDLIAFQVQLPRDFLLS